MCILVLSFSGCFFLCIFFCCNRLFLSSAFMLVFVVVVVVLVLYCGCYSVLFPQLIRRTIVCYVSHFLVHYRLNSFSFRYEMSICSVSFRSSYICKTKHSIYPGLSGLSTNVLCSELGSLLFTYTIHTPTKYTKSMDECTCTAHCDNVEISSFLRS